MDLRTWVNSLFVRFENYDSPGLLDLLFRQPLRIRPDSDIRRLVQEAVPPGRGNGEIWVHFITAHAEFRLGSERKFDLLTASLAAFTQVFQEGVQGAWSLPIVYRFSKKLFALLSTEKTGKGKKKEEAVISELQKLLGVCQKTSEKPPDSKLMGLVCVMNLLFRLYLRINNLQLCVNLLKIINSPHSKLPALRHFAMAQQVEFKYYEGRLSVYEQEIRKAEECLEFSFAHSHPGSVRNKRIVLQYLIPVKVARGKFPTRALLEKYSQEAYLPILMAIKQGDIGAFQSELERHQDDFIRTGIYIMMESLQLQAYRNLFKKTYQLLGQSQIPLQRFLASLQCVGVTQVDMEELECLLVNLIAKGWMKGYISHEHKMIVLSKKTSPFPKISEI